MSRPTAGAGLPSPGSAFGVLLERQTYRNLLYLVLAFPLGLFYYVAFTIGFVLGIALTVFVVGLAILFATVLGARSVAAFERRLATRLLDVEIAAPTDVDRAADGLVGTASSYLRAASTWRGLGFVVLKFPIGLLSFVLLVSLLGTAIDLLFLPLAPDGAMNVEIGGWRVARIAETETQRLLAVPVGAALGLVAVHVLNAFARASATVAVSLLGAGNGSAG